MSRKPATPPESSLANRYGTRRHRHASPTLRPSGDVAPAGALEWMRLVDAVKLLLPHNETAALAFDALWKRILLGIVPITCDTLIYERADGGTFPRETFPRPGAGARLAEQMLAAYGNPPAGFRLDVGNGGAQWADVSGPYPVNAIALGLQVDRAAVAMMVAPTAKMTERAAEPMTQGRPQLAHKVMPEFERRIGTGEVLLSVVGEARALADWYASNYSLAEGNKALQPKSIEPYIREKINEMRAAQKPAEKGA